MDLLLAALVVVPLGAALALTLRVTRGRAATVTPAGAAATLGLAAVLAVGVALDGPVTGGTGPVRFRFDALSLLLTGVAGIVALTVGTYAGRHLIDSPRPWAFHRAAALLLAGSVVLATADRLPLAVGGWLLATTAVLGLLATRGDVSGRAASRRAARALVPADLALVGATATTVALVGDPALSRLGPAAADLADTTLSVGPVGVPAVEVVVALLAVGALARAAQLPALGWLTGSLAAPTPVSALLHAGAVNAGGFLLVRTGAFVDLAPVATVGLLLVAGATVLVAAGSAAVRPDVKGALAASTSAQMGFMLVAVAVGAPVAAMTHLVGHGLYKASRFLGAGDAVTAMVSDRRHPAAATPWAPTARVALSLAVPVAVLGPLWVLFGLSVLPTAEAWVVGAAALAAAAQATWTWTGQRPTRAAGPAGAALLVLVGGGWYLALAAGLGPVLDPLVTHGAPGALAPAGLAFLFGALALGRYLLGHTRTGPWLVGRLAGVGRAPRPVRAGALGRPPAVATRPEPALGGAW